MSLHIDNCISLYKDIILSTENTVIEDEDNIDRAISQKEKEKKFSISFFIEINNAIFSGEYLSQNYPDKIKEFEQQLEQQDTAFSNCIRGSISELKHLLFLINNKINLTSDDLLFSALSPSNKGQSTNIFFDNLENITFRLAIIDHTLIDNSDTRNEIIIIRELILKNQFVSDENLKFIYNKLMSKCSFLLKKLFFSNEEAHKYALDFKIHDIDDLKLEDNFNEDFSNHFECLYNHTKAFNKSSQYYQVEFQHGRFSTIGFIILSQYYRIVTKDIVQINNLIVRFDRFYVKRSKNIRIDTFDQYSIDSIKHYLYNCRFSLKICQQNYSIEDLNNDIKDIKEVQFQTKIFNYHPYYKALEFLSNKIHNSSLESADLNEIKSINTLYKELFQELKSSIDWCAHRRFYPFQLEKTDCKTAEGIFIASSFARPINLKRLNNLYRDFREAKQIGKMREYSQLHKIELESVQAKIKSFRKESFEYLGIFIAIISFLFGSLQLFGNSNIKLPQALINITSLGLTLCIFVSIIAIISSDIKNKIHWLIGVGILCILLLLFLPVIISYASKI